MKNLLILFLALFLFGNVSAQKLYINEFMTSNDSSFADENGEYDDWIEIYNADTAAVNIGGMYITDDLTDPKAWQIPDTDPNVTTIPAGGFLVLWADKQTDQGILHVKLKLSGGGEQIGLFASDGTTPIDTLTFGEQTTDVSCGRFPDGSDNWVYFGKDENIGYTCSPGRSNVTIRINEFMASNDTTYYDPATNDYPDWIELYNFGDQPVDIGGYYISDDLTDLTAWQIPEGEPDSTTIPAKGFLLLLADKKTEAGVLHVKIKLSGKGEQIALTAPDGNTVIDSLTFGEQTTDVSYGRLPDGSDNWQFFENPTPGVSNANPNGVEGNKTLLTGFELLQNYPNPFNPTTTIKYVIANVAKQFAGLLVQLKVYDVLGREVATLVNEKQTPGNYSVKFNASALTSGVYFYTLKAGKFISTKKLVLIK